MGDIAAALAPILVLIAYGVCIEKSTVSARRSLVGNGKTDLLHFVPINNRIAAASLWLPGNLHKDPVDRIIVATARELNFALITKDKRLQAYPHVESIW